MQNPTIIVTGNVAATPLLRRTPNDTVVTSFRIANTPSRLDKSTGAWNDQPTTWFTVSCWRGTAEHVVQSLRQGDRVVVTGRLSTSTWTTSDGEQRSGLDIEASHVGLDLSRAPARFVTVPPLQVGSDPGERPPVEAAEEIVSRLQDLLDDEEPALAGETG